jgi:hypothetical protein
MSALAKYLERYAEAQARAAELDELREHGPWAHAVTIPARRETPECLAAAAAPAARSGPTLVVLVVNTSDDDHGGDDPLLAAVEHHAAARWRAPGLSLHRLDAHLDVLLVDRTSVGRRFGPRDGVGLARKLGGDLIARLIHAGIVRSPWIHTTDADATLPAEHFERVAKLDAPAVVAPFLHVPTGDPAVDEATLRYELSLRYYVLGLRSAGSPYAFHTIGSLLGVASQAYAQVRGFPRRRAGEDFYMLTKLAKLGPVPSLGGAPVQIQARRSTRAPFGTGPAVEALLAGRPLRVYDPEVFLVLAQALRGLERLAREREASSLHELACSRPEITELRTWVEAAVTLAERYPGAHLLRRLHEHLDGFRTLKLIHAVTEQRPRIPWSSALARASFLPGVSDELTLDEQRRRLLALEATA